MVKVVVLLHPRLSGHVLLNLEMEVSTLPHINPAVVVVANLIITPINQLLTLQPVQGLMELILLLLIHLIRVLKIDRPPGSHFVVLILPILEVSTILLMYLSLLYSTLSSLALKFLSLAIIILVLTTDNPQAILVPVRILTLQLKTLESVLNPTL